VFRKSQNFLVVYSNKIIITNHNAPANLPIVYTPEPYFQWEYLWGCCLDGESLAFDRSLIEYGDKNLIETLVIHECCHLRHPNHDRDFINLFKKFSNESYDILKHPSFSNLINVLKKKGILDNNGEPIRSKNVMPTDPKLIPFMKASGAIE